MIFLRSTLREFATAGTAVFIVLLTITFISQLIRLLGVAARGKVPADAILTLLGFSAIGSLSVLLSATLFLSVLLTLTRAYRDSEMVVWQSSGLGLLQWCKPVAIFALPIVLCVGALSLYITPWVIGKADQYRHQLETRDDVAAITPGVFKEAKSGDRVFFVEKFSADLMQVANIFVHSTQNQRQGVMVASRGYVETTPEGDRYLVLLDGRRYEGTPGQADYRVISFRKYSVRIEQSEKTSYLPSQKSRDTLQLFAEPSPLHIAELAFRVGMPISSMILAFLAIPMSAVNPRTGRFANLILAVLVFMIYSNLVSMSQAWIAQGKLSPRVGTWIVHAAMFVVLVILLAWRVGKLRGLTRR
ncbi:MAG TPA: LPS export ABC transporter permease LptF [Burkholderiales bacterium]|nr:LPS export ABC transporter permease LptF [Burkholderiales bacterium]